MSQDNLLNQNNFQPFHTTKTLYQTDMAMQFAPSVPHRQPSRRVQQQPMSYPSFQNQEQFMQPFPTSPYDRPDSIGSTSSQGTNKQLQTKAERRAEHNAIERARRESLNVKFQQLAFALPNLQNDTRPSKSTIIDRTLDFVKNAIIMEERYQKRINELEKFNKYLLSEADTRLKRKKQRAAKVSLKSASTSPIITAPALISSPTASVMKTSPNGSIASEEEYEDEDDEDEDEEYGAMHRRGSTEQAMPQFTPMKQTSQQFSPMTGAHNNNNNLLPVTQSSVSMMPTSKPEYCTNNNIANWPMTSPTHTHFFKEEQHMPYYQLQQQMIIQKFQDHSITNTKTTHEEGYNNHSPIYNNYPMLSNNNIDSFITSNIMVEPEHHHLMHRS